VLSVPRVSTTLLDLTIRILVFTTWLFSRTSLHLGTSLPKFAFSVHLESIYPSSVLWLFRVRVFVIFIHQEYSLVLAAASLIWMLRQYDFYVKP